MSFVYKYLGRCKCLVFCLPLAVQNELMMFCEKINLAFLLIIPDHFRSYSDCQSYSYYFSSNCMREEVEMSVRPEGEEKPEIQAYRRSYPPRGPGTPSTPPHTPCGFPRTGSEECILNQDVVKIPSRNCITQRFFPQAIV